MTNYLFSNHYPFFSLFGHLFVPMNNILVKILNNKQIHIPSFFCLILDFVNTIVKYVNYVNTIVKYVRWIVKYAVRGNYFK